MQQVIENIAAVCGIQVAAYDRVQGGDINECFQLHTESKKFFLKLNDAISMPGMFAAEAAGLTALRSCNSIQVPQIIQQGIEQNKQWLMLEWIEKGTVNQTSLKNFGRAIARMHLQAQPYFGWIQDNYIGSLQQPNTQHETWQDFYTQCRIMPLVQRLFDAGRFSAADKQAAAHFCSIAAKLFPEEPPALLHGDLWAGNYMINAAAEAVVYDPAVYYGHREMDIGMTALFGGFSQSFYEGYNELYPLQEGWQQRMPLAQLYPLLVHAVLFGGHYAESALAIIKEF